MIELTRTGDGDVTELVNPNTIERVDKAMTLPNGGESEAARLHFISGESIRVQETRQQIMDKIKSQQEEVLDSMMPDMGGML